MLYTNISTLQEKINQLYATAQPFFFVVNYEQSEGYLVENPLQQPEVFFKFPTAEYKPFSASPKKVDFNVIPNAFESYKSKFDRVQEYLQKQEISLVNLTERTEIETNLSLEDIFALSESPYQVYIPGKFVCFSPERFVKIADGKISTNPMKGTIDASIPHAEHSILNDKKEIDEHTTTVNLLTEELRTVANNVHTARFRYIDRVETNRKTLLQVSSEIAGELSLDYKQHFGDILFSLLPAGSIAGTPKQKAVKILREIEGIERNYYCGIAGYFDGKEFDSAVLIRFIEQDSDSTTLYFRSGGGITADSVCEKEYQEVLNKVYLPFDTQKPVFVESLRIENGKICNHELHEERMQKTAFFYYGTKPVLNIDLSLIPPDLQQGRIKCRIIYAADIIAVEYHAYQLKEIKSLRIVEDNNVEYSHKTINRDCLNSLFEQRNGADDIIIVKNGKITDSSSANLVFESFDGELFTPKTYLLAGTKRQFLLQNGTIKEKEITVRDIPLYKKVYKINAMIDVEDTISVSTDSIVF
ncbi:MAG: aminodeoxychorismate synthase component I [Bacteroidales bacterium]|jgi:para-aminobenzoate synthetase component 1|nr:aminodeoxychorismate synthase component I [Bacteroidales bacterium]